MYQVYQTGIGDTLDSIASNFNISIDELKAINNDLNSVLIPGLLIVVPSSKNNFIKYTIKKGDSIYSISKEYGVDTNTILLLNGLKENEYIYPNEVILIPKEGIDVYLSKNGDTIESLKKLGNLSEIDELNSKIYLMPNQTILYKKGV